MAMAHYGHGSLWQVVLPMLLRELVYTQSAEHWLTEADFVRGFGLVQAATRRTPACNPTHPGLQPDAPRPATRRTPACNPMHPGLQPDGRLSQAMPGPVFNLSAFLGGVVAGLPGALLAWASLFGPGLLLILAALPFWQEIQAT
jgi:hypothetical protein